MDKFLISLGKPKFEIIKSKSKKTLSARWTISSMTNEAEYIFKELADIANLWTDIDKLWLELESRGWKRSRLSRYNKGECGDWNNIPEDLAYKLKDLIEHFYSVAWDTYSHTTEDQFKALVEGTKKLVAIKGQCSYRIM